MLFKYHMISMGRKGKDKNKGDFKKNTSHNQSILTTTLYKLSHISGPGKPDIDPLYAGIQNGRLEMSSASL